jgi:thioredoxin reductase (NADPH)
VTAARLGRRALILTGGVPGGLLLSIDRIEGLPGYPDGIPGYELCPMTEEQAALAGAEFSMALLEGLEQDGDLWRVATGDGELQARTVVVAAGASLKRLGVPGEEQLQGHGVSQCASCDAPLLAGKVAAVVGGGDSALQEALTLAEVLEQVVVLHRGEELDAQQTYRQRVEEEPKITIRYRMVVEKLVGEASLTGVVVRDLASDATEELEVAAVFPFVGLQPNSEPLADLLVLDETGAIRTDAELRTERPGIFAAGIVRSGAAGRAAAAAGEGAAAAVGAHRFLNTGDWPDSFAAATAVAVSDGGNA